MIAFASVTWCGLAATGCFVRYCHYQPEPLGRPTPGAQAGNDSNALCVCLKQPVADDDRQAEEQRSVVQA
jgi:hypothetical protein